MTREIGNHHWIGVKRAVANDTASTPVEVEHRREAEIDAVRPQLARDCLSVPVGIPTGRPGIGFPDLAEQAHRWQSRERSAREALHAAAFVID